MAIQVYRDFVIFTDDVKKDEHERVKSFSVLVFWSPAGEGEKKETVIMPEIDLTVLRRRLENRELYADLEQQIRFGKLLADLLLPEYARKLFEKSLDLLGDGEGLRLRLRLEEELVALPWEYMYIQDTHGERTLSGFLALNPRISIVRHEPLEIPAEGFRSANKRRIVVAMATPQPYSDYPKLADLPNEQKLIKEALNCVAGVDVVYLPPYRGHYEDDIPGARVEDLTRALKQTTDIFHFSGHGEFTRELGPRGESVIGQGFIILAGDNNQAEPLPADDLRKLLSGRGIRLVILGACETGGRDTFNAWNSVAASLLRGEIPVVIAMQFSIYSDLSTAFMDALYESLVAGLTIDEAVALGRVAIRAKALDGRKDVRDWGVPVLYLRTPGGRVFEAVTDKEALQAAQKKVNALSLLQLGMLELAWRAFDKALGHLRQATQVNPEYSDAFKAIAWSQQSQAMNDIKAGKFDEAVRKLVDAREAVMHTDCLDPRALKLRGSIAEAMAKVAEKRNDRASAKKHYTEAKRLLEHVARTREEEEKAVEKKHPPKKPKPTVSIAKMAFVGVVIVGMVIGVLALRPDGPWPKHSYTLTVFVSDADSGVSLVGAEVFLDDEYEGVTGGDGSCVIRAVPKGVYVVRATAERCHESTQSIEVDKDTEIEMQLARARAKINNFTASPSKIILLEDSTLSWSVSGATSVTIDHEIGSVASTGTRVVSPTETTTYTLTATNEAGSVSAQAVVMRALPRVIQIGITTASTSDLETIVPFVEEILEPDIVEYVKTRGYDYTFDFLIEDNQGMAAIALEITQSFKAMGIDLIIGHGWSSQCQAALSYVNENDMLLFSASSTSPLLAIPDDRLFRACPTVLVQAPALAQMWKTWGVEAVLTIQRADVWGDGLWNILEREWPKVGIDDLGRIRYAVGVTDFYSCLAYAEDIITAAIEKYGKEKVGMQFFSFSELSTIQTQAAEYPNLIDIIWMTTEGGGRSESMLLEAGEYATKTHHFSPMMAVDDDSIEFIEFDEKYHELTGYRADFYTAAQYDACRLLVECILETGSTEASDIAEVLIPISQDYYGLTGCMALDENGDRLPQMFDIWGFYEDPETGKYLYRVFGNYNGQKNEVDWYDDALKTFAGISRPGA